MNNASFRYAKDALWILPPYKGFRDTYNFFIARLVESVFKDTQPPVMD